MLAAVSICQGSFPMAFPTPTAPHLRTTEVGFSALPPTVEISLKRAFPLPTPWQAAYSCRACFCRGPGIWKEAYLAGGRHGHVGEAGDVGVTAWEWPACLQPCFWPVAGPVLILQQLGLAGSAADALSSPPAPVHVLQPGGTSSSCISDRMLSQGRSGLPYLC